LPTVLRWSESVSATSVSLPPLAQPAQSGTEVPVLGHLCADAPNARGSDAPRR
jgi:hypothetical protein